MKAQKALQELERAKKELFNFQEKKLEAKELVH